MQWRRDWGLVGVVVGTDVLVWAGCRTRPVATEAGEYPLGIYGVRATNDLAVVREAGFNLVVGRAEREYLDQAQAAGLGVLAAPGTSAGPGFDAAAARRVVRAHDRHPALWGWYLVDEPDLQGVAPGEVVAAHRYLKGVGARKPTALVIYNGYSAGYYGGITDWTMVDRYPVPWLPLANFGQHVEVTRLALGRGRPLIAVIQAFDWNSATNVLPGETNLRPPTEEEMRCMTYDALCRGANGLFYYTYDGGWKMREHPETWLALRAVVQEVRDRLPLFRAEHRWWPRRHIFGDPAIRFNEALQSSIASAWVRVERGNDAVPSGDYVVAVNTTAHWHAYEFRLPQAPGRAGAGGSEADVAVLGEGRGVRRLGGWVRDDFGPYQVHVYGPLPR